MFNHSTLSAPTDESKAQAREFVARTKDIPPFPQSILKLLQLMRDPDAPASAVVDVVQGDAVLSAKLLQVCNSGALGLREKISSVQHAVVFLGLEEVQRVTMAVSAGSTMSQPLSKYALTGAQFWRHSLITAYAAALLAASNDVLEIQPSIAYTAGLLHDIGKLVIDRVLTPEKQAAIRVRAIQEAYTPTEAERDVLGTTHAEAGGALLEKWGLPAVLIEAAENHHTPECQPIPELSAAIYLANCLAYEIDAKPGSELNLSETGREAAAGLGLDSADMAKALRTLQDRMKKLEKFSAL